MSLLFSHNPGQMNREKCTFIPLSQHISDVLIVSPTPTQVMTSKLWLESLIEETRPSYEIVTQGGRGEVNQSTGGVL